VVVLVDQSLAEIGLTLWGSVAEKFDPEEEHPVLAVKGAKVTDYNGLSLTAMGSSVIQVLFQFFFNFFTQRVSTYSTI
jgi:replication factor A1